MALKKRVDERKKKKKVREDDTYWQRGFYLSPSNKKVLEHLRKRGWDRRRRRSEKSAKP